MSELGPHPSALPDCATLRQPKSLENAGFERNSFLVGAKPAREHIGYSGTARDKSPTENPTDVLLAFNAGRPV